MASGREALTSGDAQRFGYAVHTLAGMFRSLSADAALAAADSLESLVMAGERHGMEAGYALLEREVELLTAELVGMTNSAIGAARPSRDSCASQGALPS